MATQFRAVLECKQDPCGYCRTPGRRFTVEHPAGPFWTEDAARNHGWGMAEKVYGTEHRVIVESREVTEWEETR
jgi:hypothetical protein